MVRIASGVETAARGAKRPDSDTDAPHVAVVAGGGVIHEPQLLRVARQQRRVLQRRAVLPQPEPALPLARAAARCRRLVFVRQPGVELAAGVAR